MPVVEFLRACEERRWKASDPPSALDDLAAAMAAEWAFALDDSRAALDRARREVSAEYRAVLELIELRILVREATPATLEEALTRLTTLYAATTGSMRARVLHLIAAARLRRGQLELAELALSEGLAAIEPGLAQLWMMDTLGQLLIGQGAWSEATHVLEGLIARRRELHDELGVSISAGHLARLHAHTGNYAAASAVARDALAGLSPASSAFTRIRLLTLVLECALDGGASPDAIAEEEHALSSALATIADDVHYLVGYAHVALARAHAVRSDHTAARAARDAAARCALPASAMLHLEASIEPSAVDDAAWRGRFAEVVAQRDYVTAPEIETHLLLARHAERVAGPEAARRHLEQAGRRAAQSNNPLWMRWVDEAIERRDPVWAAERFTERFAGRPRRELTETSRARVTIIFADLVDFTPRTLELTPQQVMSTVRGLFELGVPVLTRYRVLPISYLGDGLLAMAHGEDHAARGLGFARDLVARMGRTSEMRRTLGLGWPLDLRAGVASGDVVLGVLGSMFKSDLAAIGLTTNLAARLQSSARPGEVVCSDETAREAKLDLPRERLELKGFERLGAVEACRIRVYPRADLGPDAPR